MQCTCSGKWVISDRAEMHRDSWVILVGLKPNDKDPKNGASEGRKPRRGDVKLRQSGE